MIIAIDGEHGVGKSTIIKKLKKQFENNPEITFLKFPTYTELGNLARRAVSNNEPNEVLNLLFCADYNSELSKHIISIDSKLFILDRYVLTLFTYQGLLKGCDYDHLAHLCSNIPKPDIQIIISKPVASKNDNYFFQTIQKTRYFDNVNVYFIENIMDYTCDNEEGFIRTKEIIESEIGSYLIRRE